MRRIFWVIGILIAIMTAANLALPQFTTPGGIGGADADSIKGKPINSVPVTDQYIMKYFSTGDTIGWTADGGASGGTSDTLIFNVSGTEYTIVSNRIKMKVGTGITFTREDSTVYDVIIIANVLGASVDSTELAANMLEWLEDNAGNMFSGNTETGITVTYQDADGTVDFAVNVPVSDTLAAQLYGIKASPAAFDNAVLKLDTDTAPDSQYWATDEGAGSGTADSTYLNDGTSQYGPFTNDMFKIKEGTDINITREDSTTYEVFKFNVVLPDTLLGVNEAGTLYQPLEATLSDIADGTIAENLVNTANPWADNEIASSGNWNTAFGWGNHAGLYVPKSDSGSWAEVAAKFILNQASIGNVSDSNVSDSAVSTRGYVTSRGYITGNQTITLSGDVSGSGTTAITTSLNTDVVDEAHVNWGTAADQISLIDIPGTAWRVIYTNGTGVTTELALGGSGTYLKSNGATSAPTWDTPAGGGSDTALVLSEAYGSVKVVKWGTDTLFVFDNTAGAQNIYIKSNADGRLIAILDSLVAGGARIGSFDGTRLSVSSGILNVDLAGAAINLESEITGTLPVGNGGTGAITLTDGGILLGSGTGAITSLGVAANGQIPIGDATTDPVLATISGTTNEIEITNGAGSITVGITDPATLGTVNGTLDMGAATSLEIPNATDPATTIEGQIAWDNNDDAIEVYSGDEAESALIPMYRRISALIVMPDSVQKQGTGNFAIFHADALMYPFGIEIDQVSITLDADAAYSLEIEEWSGADPPVLQNVISTVVTTSVDAYAEEVPDTDGNIDADDRIYLDLPTTDVPWIHVNIIYHVTQGN